MAHRLLSYFDRMNDSILLSITSMANLAARTAMALTDQVGHGQL